MSVPCYEITRHNVSQYIRKIHQHCGSSLVVINFDNWIRYICGSQDDFKCIIKKLVFSMIIILVGRPRLITVPYCDIFMFIIHVYTIYIFQYLASADITRIGRSIVRILPHSMLQILDSSTGRVKPKTIILVCVASLLTQAALRSWSDCCFSVLAL